ncbi:glycerophosphodiester phosphodiesterase family protein [Gimibacter soli]|uniref:Glycerophosphodiester phosphodiesterase family protein n=1 Tax=Gimibacter soli TaxID=3024400 RepID=A0AAF0BIQ7_9PROT|nr:glycerophosphodiester phosphodiesterase family protein [Gimibacter soli]WCL55693.1 glycerophosphodiester phosphodiesterase family protein [Gimibacter soli]
MTETRTFPWLAKSPVAHRGLHARDSVRVENTLPAVEAAVAQGFAIEIDVRLSADGQVVVFHDKTLDRLTAGVGLVKEVPYADLKALPVGASGLPMPLLADVLHAIGSNVALYIEVKTEKDTKVPKLMAAVREALHGYHGPVAIMSFNPYVTDWCRHHLPLLPRGIIMGKETLSRMRARLLIPYWLKRTQPDFLAVDVNLLPNKIIHDWRAKGGLVATWTVRTAHQEKVAAQHADAPIFESPAVTG